MGIACPHRCVTIAYDFREHVCLILIAFTLTLLTYIKLATMRTLVYLLYSINEQIAEVGTIDVATRETPPQPLAPCGLLDFCYSRIASGPCPCFSALSIYAFSCLISL